MAGMVTAYPAGRLVTVCVPTEALAVSAPLCVPATRPMLTLPVASLRALPEAGRKPPLLSVVTKLTTVVGTALPVASNSTAVNVPGCSGVMAEVGPLALLSASTSVGCAGWVGVVGGVGVAA